jgi:hypothetical protein
LRLPRLLASYFARLCRLSQRGRLFGLGDAREHADRGTQNFSLGREPVRFGISVQASAFYRWCAISAARKTDSPTAAAPQRLGSKGRFLKSADLEGAGESTGALLGPEATYLVFEK